MLHLYGLQSFATVNYYVVYGLTQEAGYNQISLFSNA